LHAIKSSKNKNIKYPLLKTTHIKKVLSKLIDIVDVSIKNNELYFVVKQTITLPVTGDKVEYELEVFYDLELFLERVYLSKDLKLQEIISHAKKENEDSFLVELELILQECRVYAKTWY
jgi:hypothetical protein